MIIEAAIKAEVDENVTYYHQMHAQGIQPKEKESTPYKVPHRAQSPYREKARSIVQVGFASEETTKALSKGGAASNTTLVGYGCGEPNHRIGGCPVSASVIFPHYCKLRHLERCFFTKYPFMQPPRAAAPTEPHAHMTAPPPYRTGGNGNP
eukprot:TRINITY_DN628_c1_g2_i1.p1 TRINITY_DN628_c1_g2~~TRINITY_DN628_c1_g2_i1.p1  ORF type:complete len:151 (+),score=7.00 TRINITY_DN628_c1_g2_i1:151-603(+)